MSTDEQNVESRRLQLRQQMWAHRKHIVSGHKEPVRSGFPRSSLMQALTQERGRKIAMAVATALMAKPKLRWVSLAVMAGVVGYAAIKSRSSPTSEQEN